MCADDEKRIVSMNSAISNLFPGIDVKTFFVFNEKRFSGIAGRPLLSNEPNEMKEANVHPLLGRFDCIFK